MPIDAVAAPHAVAAPSLIEGILPVGIASRTVTTGPWTLPDGTVATGRATITCPVNLVHVPTGQPLASGDMSVRLVNGLASWDLCPTDQAGLNRVDFAYTLRVELNGALVQPEPITFLLPAAGPSPVDLDPLASVPSTAGTPVAPITVTSVNAKTGAVTLTAADVGAAPASTVGGVSSVNTKTGAVVLAAADVGADAAGAATAAQMFAVQRANHTGTQPASTVTGLATVATSGAYTDLTAKPAIPTVASAGTAGAALSATDATVTNARTPTTHAGTHASGGSDPVSPATIGAEVSGAASAAQAFAIQRTNHTGTQSADTLTDGGTNKAFLATERTKLTGVATGATANATDAQLRDRSTHTGTQAASTITGLATVATSGAYADLAGAPLLAPTFTSGSYYYANSPSGSATSAALGIGTLRVSPLLLLKPVTLARLVAEVTTIGDVGSKVRLGIYADNGSGYPGALVVDAGQIAGDSATVQELTISTALAAGLYWVGAAVQTVTTTQPTIRIASSWISPVTVWAGTTLPGANSTANGISASAVTGALPGTFPVGGTPAGPVPRLLFKVA